MQRNTLGQTGIEVSPLCIGTSPIANLAHYGYTVSDEQAIATIEAVFDSEVNFLDTSNGYGEDGLAEHRVGAAVRRRGGLPEGFVLQTKVDPDPATGDYSGDRVRRSVEESLERLGVDHLPILALHDPEFMRQDGFAPGGALEALIEIRESGVADHLAVAAGDLRVTQEYLDTGEFDVVLNHNRYTLLNREAEELFTRARAAGLGVLNAAPYGGGMLAKGPAAQPKYCYGERDEAIGNAAFAMSEACERAGVPLIAAALQFSVRSPLVDATVVGVSRPERVQDTIDLLAVDIPESLWEELEALVPKVAI
ncbi:aldo/keto reductase [Glycomyces sp. TRM65418]|uniref:aldo/keto reductase n=1 Tax=Glycomyces sp. TRM65418 TaxID=2867006 RepID=UPI001CE65108|nr:aldo/keto reductase [Glycomyces sp. TRM65418]MCC3762884.1 aldo/keto reductase [Glycomyces sp. TRM65418]QZD56910.1 aldo/keto reductase [Glycomyces sp. TRM65418]